MSRNSVGLGLNPAQGTLVKAGIILACACACAALVSVPAVEAFAASPASCSDNQYRAGDFSYSTTDDGVGADLILPYDASLVAGFSSTSGRMDAADIYLYHSGGVGFVQFGWYVGTADQLPYASQPTVFVGESHTGSTNNEVLRTFQTLSWNSLHHFKIVNEGNGHYDFYMSGNLITTSIYSHSLVDSAAVNGETDNSCVDMYEQACQASSPYSTLEYRDQSSHAWHFFSDNYFADSGYTSTTDGYTATNIALGGP